MPSESENRGVGLSGQPDDQLRLIIDNVPAMIWTASPSGARDFINRPFLEYTGLSFEEGLGAGFVAMHPEDRPQFLAQWEQAVQTGTPLEREIRLRRADGEYCWFLHRIVPLRDESGNVLKWVATAANIHESKRSEQRLRQIETYLAEAQRLSQTGSWAWKPATGDIRYWSEECYRVLGFDPAGPTPRFDAFFQRLHPDDQAPIRELYEKAIRDKADFETGYRYIHPEKGVRDIHVVAHAVLDRSGDFGEFVGTVIDVTERKRAEQELQWLVDFVPQLIVVLDSDGKVIHANRVARDYTGLTLDAFRTPGLFGRIIHPDDAERVRAARKCGFAGSEPFELDARLLGKDCNYRWFLGRYNPLVEEGRGRRWYVSATEIESRKQEEERVRQENARLEERTRIARDLHDTLLQTVQSASLQLGATLFGIPPDSPMKPVLDRILRLMKQGIEEGRDAIQGLRSSDPHTSDLVLALSRIQEELRIEPEIDFRVMVSGRLRQWPPRIQDEIYRIGREALLNAFSHSAAKRVELELEYSDSVLRMWVRDNGCGIDPRVLDTGRAGHWGLAGMRERATKLGGLLKISSSATGTEIELSLPLT